MNFMVANFNAHMLVIRIFHKFLFWLMTHFLWDHQNLAAVTRPIIPFLIVWHVRLHLHQVHFSFVPVLSACVVYFSNNYISDAMNCS